MKTASLIQFNRIISQLTFTLALPPTTHPLSTPYLSWAGSLPLVEGGRAGGRVSGRIGSEWRIHCCSLLSSLCWWQAAVLDPVLLYTLPACLSAWPAHTHTHTHTFTLPAMLTGAWLILSHWPTPAGLRPRTAALCTSTLHHCTPSPAPSFSLTSSLTSQGHGWQVTACERREWMAGQSTGLLVPQPG